jgi:hypothetical protein
MLWLYTQLFTENGQETWSLVPALNNCTFKRGEWLLDRLLPLIFRTGQSDVPGVPRACEDGIIFECLCKTLKLCFPIGNRSIMFRIRISPKSHVLQKARYHSSGHSGKGLLHWCARMGISIGMTFSYPIRLLWHVGASADMLYSFCSRVGWSLSLGGQQLKRNVSALKSAWSW